mgnify:CR=1 FL=1
MTSEEAMKIKEIFDLCLQINVLNKHQVFFSLYTHTDSISIDICEGHWKKDKPTETHNLCYNTEKEKFFAGTGVYRTYRVILKVLEKILKEDMSHDVNRFLKTHAH